MVNSSRPDQTRPAQIKSAEFEQDLLRASRIYDGLSRNEETNLGWARQIGVIFNKVKEKLVEGGEDWQDWFTKFVKWVSIERARLFMRIERNWDKVKKCTSIQEARELLKAERPNQRPTGSTNGPSARWETHEVVINETPNSETTSDEKVFDRKPPADPPAETPKTEEKQTESPEKKKSSDKGGRPQKSTAEKWAVKFRHVETTEKVDVVLTLFRNLTEQQKEQFQKARSKIVE